MHTVKNEVRINAAEDVAALEMISSILELVESTEKSIMLSTNATHICIHKEEEFILLIFYNCLLHLKSIGPVIENDFVIMGKTIKGSNGTVSGPSLCKIEKETVNETNGILEYTEYIIIEPWHILMQDAGDGIYDFTIPVTLSDDANNAKLKITIYAQDDMHNIPYTLDDTANFDMYSSSHIPCVSFEKENDSLNSVENEVEMSEEMNTETFVDVLDDPEQVQDTMEEGMFPEAPEGVEVKPYKVVTVVKIPVDDDEYDLLRLDGYLGVSITYPDKEGSSADLSIVPSKRIMLKMGTYDEEEYGIEDVVWYSCTREGVSPDDVTTDTEEEVNAPDEFSDLAGYVILRNADFSTDPKVQ
jgi:hypothetical protein